MGKYQKLPYYGTLKEVGREEDLRLAGEDRSPKKWIEARMKYSSWWLIEVVRTHRQPMFLKEQRTLLLLLLHMEIHLHSFLTLGLNGGVWSASCLGQLHVRGKS
jgi:hypothetical protein